jgi:hypothetical protein
MSYDGTKVEPLHPAREQQQQQSPKPEEEQQCALRADPFIGVYGWTGAHPSRHEPQAWDPNSLAVCFKRIEDWDHLGVLLSK